MLFKRMNYLVRLAHGVARKESLANGHICIGTVHWLLALLQVPGVAALVLRDMGITIESVRAWSPQGVGVLVPGGYQPLSSNAKLALGQAIQEMVEMSGSGVDLEHVLIGLASGSGVAAQIIAEAGVTADQVRERVFVYLRAAAASASPSTPYRKHIFVHSAI